MFVRFSANLRLRFAPFDETSEFRCGRPSSFNDEDPWLLHVPCSAEWSSRITSDLGLFHLYA